MSENGFLPVPAAPLQPEILPPQPGPAFDNATLEEAYLLDREMLFTKAPSTGQGVLLLGTLGLFILTQLRGKNTIWDVVALVLVLLVHECGHFAGMKLSGYRDVKMFFIPFFGAAVSGRKGAASGWKEALVLLLGPIPGIVGGFILGERLRVHPAAFWHSVAASAVYVNLFNLLPISPLDGGQFFRLLLFSRHRYLELAFAALAGVILIVGGFAAGFIFLPLIGLQMLITLPRQSRLLRAAKELRTKHAALPADPAEMDDRQLRDLFLATQEVIRGAPRRRPRDGAAAMEQVLERTVSQTPSILASFFLVIPWLAAIPLGLAAAYVVSLSGEPRWTPKDVPAAGFSIQLPHKTDTARIVRKTPFGDTAMQSLDATGTSGLFDIRWYDAPSPIADEEKFLDESVKLLAARVSGSVVDQGALSGGTKGRAFRITSESYGLEMGRIVLRGDRVFILLAPAEPGSESSYFFDSLTLK